MSQQKTFRLMEFDEGGVEGPPENRRLVCVLDVDGKLAIWGQDGKMENINKVKEAGLPCTVKCQWREPEDRARKHGHTCWVPENFELNIVE